MKELNAEEILELAKGLKALGVLQAKIGEVELVFKPDTLPVSNPEPVAFSQEDIGDTLDWTS